LWVLGLIRVMSKDASGPIRPDAYRSINRADL
jgi:hypothetical protein